MRPKSALKKRKRLYATALLLILATSTVATVLYFIGSPAPLQRRLFVEVWNPVTHHSAAGFIAVELVYPGTTKVHEEIPLNTNYGFGFSEGNYTVGQVWDVYAFDSSFKQYSFGNMPIMPYQADPSYYILQPILNQTAATQMK